MLVRLAFEPAIERESHGALVRVLLVPHAAVAGALVQFVRAAVACPVGHHDEQVELHPRRRAPGQQHVLGPAALAVPVWTAGAVVSLGSRLQGDLFLQFGDGQLTRFDHRGPRGAAWNGVGSLFHCGSNNFGVN